MKNDDSEEKRKKAGHPIFIFIIFIVLLAFIFYAPDVYKKYNKDVAEFLGVGQNSESNNNENEEDTITAMSAYYQVGSRSTVEFNQITVSNISLNDGILYLTVETEDAVNLDELNYYIEFYEGRTSFIGRRSLTGTVEKSKDFEIDVSKLNVTNSTYFALSHIADNIINPIEMETDESGIGTLTCTNGNYTYSYDFNLTNLIKVVLKYSYTNTNISEYSDKLLEAQKKVNEYNELNGVTASIVDNSSTFIFTSEFDYETIKSYSVDEAYIFQKDTQNNVIKFKMEAEGFDCE